MADDDNAPTPANPEKGPEKGSDKGHPLGLYVLFSAEMWERFCYYTMRGLLTLYLIKALAMGDERAFAIYGAYTALVYAAPVIGGQVADRILGYRRAVILGGVMMMVGEFIICLGTEDALFLGMGVIIVGNGYFKANISSIVGKLYRDGDPRRDSGFTIFYMGINIGAVGATLIGAPVGEGLSRGSMGDAGYLVGFALAGVGMVAGLAFFVLGKHKLEGKGEPPDPAKLAAPYFAGMSLQTVTIVLSVVIVPVLYYLLQHKELVDILLLVALAVVVIQLLQAAFAGGDRVQRDRIFVLMILMVFNVVFWACFEQAGSSLTLFADRNVDRMVLGWEMPASMTQFFNPAFIILFGSFFSVMWIRLEERNANPNIPLKFGLGIVQLGLGYLLLYVGASMAGDDAKVPLLILAFMYLLHTTGELFLSPIGLSMVTKLAPKHMTGAVMGAWFLSFAFSNSLAATIAQSTGAGEGGGEAATGLDTYVDIYTQMGVIALAIGVALSLASPWLNKMMHGVK
ncbi:peptide MFS transporter [Paraliomyxa miuraensis]|uniref:peptide MFS transporter n=1 Tax=Paraliomyxa miuraensis TaxID=376150 RepID=UPI00225BC0DB|nr:oligopeptide:H+ symporter [Paraliomyxa miuraensis]MCX4243776.1 oligopeptide:H+ symporter [Paraliomyxa miuraensis]